MVSQMCKFSLLLLIALSSLCCFGQSLKLADNGQSTYQIVIPGNASDMEKKSATILQNYFQKVTGAKLDIREEGRSNAAVISIGNTKLAASVINKAGIKEDGYAILSQGGNVIITGNRVKGTLYGVYTFVEKYLGCRKWYTGPPQFTRIKTLTLPADLSLYENPVFEYRESYFPGIFDPEYADWHKLHRFIDQWGLYGDTYEKLVPAAVYYKSHPEYFGMVKGKRLPNQLCTSNKEVVEIIVDSIRRKMQRSPNARYWSISPNAGPGYCECNLCAPVTKREGSVAGNLLLMVNQVAARFPDSKFTILAHGYTQSAPKYARPASNVIVQLTSIESDRLLPFTQSPSARKFINDLAAWRKVTGNIFIWDYCAQFTSFLSPFPILPIYQPNLQFMRKNMIKGVLEQGSGPGYSDMAELKGYVLAKLLWNPDVNVDQLVQEFTEGYYGPAGQYVRAYLSATRNAAVKTHATMDIFGNVADGARTFLSPVYLNQYNDLLAKAKKASGSNSLLLQRVGSIQLVQDYTFLHQARYYGNGKRGLHGNASASQRAATPDTLQSVLKRFLDNGVKVGPVQVAEFGLSPGAYAAEVKKILAMPARENMAMNAKVSLKYPYVKRYEGKGAAMLTDGVAGFGDFSYNWLQFSRNPMVATLDMGKPVKADSIQATFLYSPDFNMFLPAVIKAEVSMNGRDYTLLQNIDVPPPAMRDRKIKLVPFKIATNRNKQFRFLRVTAEPPASLPDWAWAPSKYPVIGCDEIWVY